MQLGKALITGVLREFEMNGASQKANYFAKAPFYTTFSRFLA